MKIKDIHINPKNPRYIKDDRFLKLKNNIIEFPKMMKLRPIIIDDSGMILGGNMRYLALKDLGYKDIPDGWVVKASELTEEERKQFTILDNVPFGDWDYDLLANEWEMEKLQDWGINLDEFKIEIEGKEDDFDVDKAVEEVGEPICKRGEIWQLGEHRLMCGDATVEEDVKKLMDGIKINLLLTDPPYGISLVKNNMVGADFGVAKKGKYKPVIGDGDISITKKAFDILATITNRMIIFGGNYFLDFLPISDGWIIWDKRCDSGIRNTFADGEMAWCSFHTPIRIYHQLWNGMIREGEHDKRLHPTQKPVKLLTEIIKDFTNENDIIADLFGGSGSTLIACEQLNRKCYMSEIDPVYCDVIIKRWETYTNKKAVMLNER